MMTRIENAPDSVELSEGAKVGQPRKDYSTAPAFTPAELQAMHKWCLKYRDLVRSGGKPSGQQDNLFRMFSTVCYATGAAYEHC
ncbi:hypothetical protein Q6D67_20825 [Haliea sp. E1-2-M8]|uniref:hypothetical protein n=1 Tax=Haliea sp. E1-2-M8 TaxID=3064706 RepID=UPI00271DD276|nr:hypothetical protein [Haliea sp. E1-2-M8]MDO8864134.1 hypothetical protein [Haliea sp. E1-2-M8]